MQYVSFKYETIERIIVHIWKQKIKRVPKCDVCVCVWVVLQRYTKITSINGFDIGYKMTNTEALTVREGEWLDWDSQIPPAVAETIEAFDNR